MTGFRTTLMNGLTISECNDCGATEEAAHADFENGADGAGDYLERWSAAHRGECAPWIRPT